MGALSGGRPLTAAVVRYRLTVAELHALDMIGSEPPADVTIAWCDPTDAAVVLGSRQPPSSVDPVACEAAGLSVVRRRSGGGAVLVVPSAVVWIDVVAPPGALPDDIRGSMQWVGSCWAQAIGSIAPESASSISVHNGGMVSTAWSSRLCFAGVGPGELLLSGHKLVGLSQRRTRHGVRVQGMLHRRQPPVDLARLLTGSLPHGPIPPVAVLEPASPELLVAALAAAVADHLRS